ncbi:MAG: hypothetical protein HKN23_00505, partial [Verrucomicrobiales bacterium]|nr:hypothetical protein [Verrucomicrobiales bacterium]
GTLWPEGVLDIPAKPRPKGKGGDEKGGKGSEKGTAGNPPGEESTTLPRSFHDVPQKENSNDPPQDLEELFPKPPEIPDDFTEVPMPPIEGELRDRFFKHRPRDFLIDPQQMLSEQRSNDLASFLRFHAEEEENEIDIYLIVLGKGQSVPVDISLKNLHRDWFGDVPTALVVTQMGSLGRTQMIYGDPIHAAIEPSALSRIYQHCLREAQTHEDDSDQIETMALELAAEIYWVSQLMKTKDSESTDRVTSADLTSAAAAASAEANSATTASNAAPVAFSRMGLESRSGLPWWWMLGIIGTLGIILLAWIGSWFWRRDSLSSKPVLFEERQLPPRLGGEYSGGGYIGISYEVGHRE